MPTNTSYISGASDYAELFLYLDQSHIYDLLAKQESEVETTLTDALITEQQNRLNTALNWGRSIIDSLLGELYEVSALTEADAPALVKEWNARLAQFQLERRRLRNGEASSDDFRSLSEEIKEYAYESSPGRLPWTRRGGIVSGVESKATQFDSPGQFESIIPESDQYEVWPDLKNQL